MSYFAPYLDESGLHIPTYADRLEALLASYRSVFGPEINLTESSPDYQLLSIFARALDDFSALLVSLFAARNPSYAAGTALDLLLPLYGLTRRGATYSTVPVTLTGTPNAVLSAAPEFLDDAGNIWACQTAGLTGSQGSSGRDLAAVFTDLQAYAASIAESFASVRSALTTPLAMPEEGSFLDVLSQFSGQDGSGMEIPVTLNTAEAEKAAQSFVAKVQSLRPALSVNTTGVTSAVASAVSQIRSMLSALQIIVPVTALVRLQYPPGFTRGPGSGGGTPPGDGGTPGYAEGARISAPSLARIGENADPEYIIPVRKERRAVPLIRSLLGELSGAARSAVLDMFRSDALRPNALRTDELRPDGLRSDMLLPDMLRYDKILSDVLRTDALQTNTPSVLPNVSVVLPAAPAVLPDAAAVLPEAASGWSDAPASLPDVSVILPHVPNASPERPEAFPELPDVSQLPAVRSSSEEEPSVTQLFAPLAFSFDSIARFLAGRQSQPLPAGTEPKAAAAPITYPPVVLSVPLPDLSSLAADLSALTAAARMNFFPQGSGGGNQYHSVDAPVTIQVSAPAASPEAVGRSVYDLTQRHILKTLEGVFR